MTARIIALAAFAWIGLVDRGAAQEAVPLQHKASTWLNLPWRQMEDWPVRGNLAYRLHLPFVQQVQPSSKLAPWYMWWPADANQTLTQHDFQSSPYPTWPASAPQSALAPRPQGQLTYAPPPQQYQPNPYQTVSYPRTQVPSYWYGR